MTRLNLAALAGVMCLSLFAGAGAAKGQTTQADPRQNGPRRSEPAMYIPSTFRQDDPAQIEALIRQYSFGLLVSDAGGEPVVTHLPMVLQHAAGDGGHGCLIGHMAHGNPQWRELDGRTVLAVFSGPHAYISPAWSGSSVPTWDYAAVHVHGTFHVIQDEDEALRVLRDSVDVFEAARAEPWRLDTGPDNVRKMLQGLVAFRIQIARVEGKWKLSQNQSPAGREKVAKALDASGDQDAQRVATMMRQAGEQKDKQEKRAKQP